MGVTGEEALSLHHKGETVKAIVLDIDSEKERISLGIKQLERGGIGAATSDGSKLNKSAVVTVTVLAITDGGLEVQAGDDGAAGFIKRGGKAGVVTGQHGDFLPFMGQFHQGLDGDLHQVSFLHGTAAPPWAGVCRPLAVCREGSLAGWANGGAGVRQRH